MKGSKTRRLALSIASVLFIVGGLFVSLAIYASKMIWPDPLAITYEVASKELVPDALEVADQSSQSSAQSIPTSGSRLPDTVATLRKPKAPDAGGDSHPVITSLAADISMRTPATLTDPHSFESSLPSDNDTTNLPPKRVAQAAPDGLREEANGDHPVSIASIGPPVRESAPVPLNDLIANLTAPKVGKVVQAMHDAEYQLDMQIAALARPIDTPISPAPPVEIFTLSSTTPQPLPEFVFAMAELDVSPQRFDLEAVQAVSQSLSPPDLSAAPAPTPAAIIRDELRRGAPGRMITPAELVAANSSDLSLLPPMATLRESDKDLVQHLAKVLAAIPHALPDESVGVSKHAAPVASPRPMLRQHSDPTAPVAPDRVAEPPRPSAEPTVAVVTPASTPATTSVRWDDGRSRMSVVGIFNTDSAPWALLETSDGRIIKATKGTILSGFRVTRIGGGKIWLRDGGMEKGLTTGQAVVLD